MLFSNLNHINYYERYQKIIEDYNNEKDRTTIEKTLLDLMNLANSMNEEEKTLCNRGLSNDEELTLYDMSFRSDLTKEDAKKLKEVLWNYWKKSK